jgi:hypothetical protein
MQYLCKSVKRKAMTEHQIKILKTELVPMIVKDIMPLIEKVVEKRLQLFVDEFIKQSEVNHARTRKKNAGRSNNAKA